MCTGSGLWPPSQILETSGDHKPRDFEIKSCFCQQRDYSWTGGLEPATLTPISSHPSTLNWEGSCGQALSWENSQP